MNLSHQINVRFTFYELPPSYNHEDPEGGHVYIVHNPPVVLSIDKKTLIPLKKIKDTLRYILMDRFGHHKVPSSFRIHPLTGLNTELECEGFLKRVAECRDFCAIFKWEEEKPVGAV